MKYNKFRFLLEILNKSGALGVITYKPLPKLILNILSKFGFYLKDKYIAIHIKNYNHPIWMRYGSSDPTVLRQVLIEEEYSCLDDLDEPKLIIDCGANVGYASIYFLQKYPNAHVIAVEPDPENFKLAQKNLLPYSERVSLVCSAIWSHEVGLVIYNYGEGQEWSTQVKECRGDQKPDLMAIDIPFLLKKSKFKSIDLLKMDIEGAEAVVFSRNYLSWLTQVKNLVIELHNEECGKAFFNALSAYKYELSTHVELTVCKKLLPKIDIK